MLELFHEAVAGIIEDRQPILADQAGFNMLRNCLPSFAGHSTEREFLQGVGGSN